MLKLDQKEGEKLGEILDELCTEELGLQILKTIHTWAGIDWKHLLSTARPGVLDPGEGSRNKPVSEAVRSSTTTQR